MAQIIKKQILSQEEKKPVAQIKKEQILSQEQKTFLDNFQVKTSWDYH